MKLRILTLSLAAVLTGCMSSCQSTLPPGSSITVGTGKNVVQVDASGKPIKQVLKEAAQKALALGGRLAVDFAISYMEDRLRAANSGK